MTSNEFYFWTGFLFGAAICLLVIWLISVTWVTTQEYPRRNYTIVDGMTCIELNGDFVSCNWDEWERAR